MTRNAGVLLVVQGSAGGLPPETPTDLAAAATLAREMGCALAAALVGHGATLHSKFLSEHGAAITYVVDHPALENGALEATAHAVGKVVEQATPEVVLVPQTTTVRGLAPYVALAAGAAVATNCTMFRYDAGSGEVEARCAVMGGSMTATYRFEGAGLKVIAFQKQDVPPAQTSTAPTPRVVTVDAALDKLLPRTKVVARDMAGGPNITDARILVAGGRGIGSRENFRYIEQLAEAMGGLPAASRGIVDLGWATPAQQVGLTGRVVSPDLYIAIGISGASQHMAGCSTAKTIVAVNNDRQSYIFGYAKYGVLADCTQFMPAFLAECRRLRTPGRAT